MKNRDKKLKLILLICDIVLITVTIAAVVIYSGHIRKSQMEIKTEDFIRTIETMKQVSQNYLNSERGYVKDWAAYISGHDMSMDEALEFVRAVNTNRERFVHIVDMESYEAYSSYYPKGQECIDTYVKYKDSSVEAELPFSDIMQSMFEGTNEEFAVLGKYRIKETQATGVGIGTRVTLRTEDGTKDYLMLRIIPTDELKRSWVFPVEYSSAEVGIITTSGDYVIQSASMKSLNFPEYIRGYNFQDDYNAGEALRQQLQTTQSGILEYKNFRGTDCLWYYSSFSEESSLDILGVLNIDELGASMDAWYIVVIVCGALIVLVAVNGVYLLTINRRLREAARASEQACRAKTQFLSAMSHDIRTPLNAVMGMMEIAKKKSDNSSYVTECMDKGINSGKQLLTLINDVLDISRIESGKFTLNMEKVSIVDMVHDLTQMLEPDIERKKLRFECDIDSLTYKYVMADRMRLNQIYVNLLSNAVKYTDAGGKIILRMYEEEIPDNTRDTRLVFYVEDTGIGMTEEFQKNMYNTFSREVKTQVNATQGTGLGLSIVKQVVDLMNGTIECQSAPGKGTAFTVRIDLPIIEGGEESVLDSVQTQSVEGMHLLIAEDNELNWEIANELLLERQIKCDHAENGQECIDMLTKSPAGTYDAVLMDVHMPVMDGLEATKTIRLLSDDALCKIPIVAMTADAFAEDVQSCIECGMNGHIAKPIDIDKLIEYLVKIKNKNFNINRQILKM